MAKGTFQLSQDFDTALMIGAIEGVQNISSFALGANLTADTPVILGTDSADPTLPSDSGDAVVITSADAGNAGAEILVDFLDTDFLPQQDTVFISGAGTFALNGGNPVTRINGARNIADRGNELTGDLNINKATAPAEVYAVVTADAQESQQAIYTIPANVTWSVTSLTASMRKSAGVDTDVALVLFAGEVGKVIRKVFGFGLQRSGDTTLEFTNRGVQGVSGPVDLYLTAESSATGADVSARLTARTAKR